MKNLVSWLLIATLCFSASTLASRAQFVSRVVDLILASTCGANQWVNAIAASGTATCAQPATTNLSDITTGAWTPTLIGSSTPGTGQTYTIQVGSYEKVGRQVTVRFTLQASSLGTAAGNMLIGGLSGVATPTATTNDYGSCWVSNYTATGLAASNIGLGGLVQPSATSINIQQFSNTTGSALTVAQAGASFLIVGGCNFHT